jgi:hypothetical protein
MDSQPVGRRAVSTGQRQVVAGSMERLQFAAVGFMVEGLMVERFTGAVAMVEAVSTVAVMAADAGNAFHA